MKNCLVCNLECDDLLNHVKTEWHTYNLRRDTAGLNAISYENFKSKQNDIKVKCISMTPKDYYCCHKLFKSVQTYENHLKSKKHIGNKISNNDVKKKTESSENCEEEIDEDMIEEEIDEDMIEEECESEEEKPVEPLTVLDCLFCKNSFESINTNLIHMTKKHNFSLPYPNYVSDLDGLMDYLVGLIDEFNVCIQCNKQFDDRISVRNHMRDSNHMQLYFHLETNGDDLCEFYSNLPNPVASICDPEDDMQIEAVLPNGKRVGNRNMKIYFNQNLNGLSNTEHLAITSGLEKARMTIANCGKYGQLATTTVQTKQDKKIRTLTARNIQLRNSRFSNFQQHFRAQILM